MSELMTTSQFNDHIRESIKSVAMGEHPHLHIRDFNIESMLSPADQAKITPSYLRTTCNRVPEVKEIGSVSVKRIDADPELAPGYIVTIRPLEETKKKQRRILTPDEQRRLKSHAAALELKRFADYVSPIMLTATGQVLDGAREAIAQFQQAIKDRINELEAE